MVCKYEFVRVFQKDVQANESFDSIGMPNNDLRKRKK